MLELILPMLIIGILGGLGLKYLLSYTDAHITHRNGDSFYVPRDVILRINWKEYALGVGIIIILVPMITILGWNVAKADKLSFNEYWNGYETFARWDKTDCYEDGPCHQAYSCDPYTTTTYTTDDKGNVTAHTETHWRSCPYATQEWSFTVETTLGNYLIAANWLPTKPERWDKGEAIPDNIPRGIPAFWQAAKDRIDAGKPGPVTKRMPYDNYLLASDSSILKTYSDKIEALKKAGKLPKITHDVHDFYLADKVYGIGFSPDKSWQNAIGYLDAAFGTELQGDLHLVIVNDSSIDVDKDGYITALKAYWSNPTEFGDDAASKNTVIIVLGTDGNTVTWARAITGMPLGNEYLLQQISQKLVGAPLQSGAILGSVNGEIYKKGEKTKVRAVDVDSGILPRLLWGIDEANTKFTRVSMSGGNIDDNGTGFKYLDDQIQPSDTFKGIIFILIVLAIGALWMTLGYNSIFERD